MEVSKSTLEEMNRLGLTYKYLAQEQSGFNFVFGEKLKPGQVIQEIIENGPGFLVQLDGFAASHLLDEGLQFMADFKRNLNSATDEIFGPNDQDYFFEFNSMEQKTQMIGGAEAFLMGVPRLGTAIRSALSICEELFMNAILAGHGKVLAEKWRELEMPAGKSGRIHIGADSRRLVIDCVDTVAKLIPMEVIQIISGCYKNGVLNSMNFGPGGAGLGTFISFENSAVMCLSSIRNCRSEVTSVIPLGMTTVKRVALPKSLLVLNSHD